MNRLERRLTGLTFAAATLITCGGTTGTEKSTNSTTNASYAQTSTPKIEGCSGSSTFSQDIRKQLNCDPIKESALLFFGSIGDVDSAMKQLPAHLQTPQTRAKLDENGRAISQCFSDPINFAGVVSEDKGNDKWVHFPLQKPCTFNAPVIGSQGQTVGSYQATRSEVVVVMSKFDNKYFPTQIGFYPAY